MTRVLAVALLGCLTSCGKDTDAWLVDLEDGESFTRLLAAIALRGAPAADHPRAAGALARLLHDEQVDRVREHGVASLHLLASASPAVFVDLLGDPESVDYRYRLIGALAKVGDRARPPLLDALRSDDPTDWPTIAEALGRLGPRSISLLVAWASDGDPSKLAAAMAGLEAVGVTGAQRIPDLATRLLAHLDGGDRWPRAIVLGAIRDASRDSATAAWALAQAAEAESTVDRDAVLAAVVHGVLRGLLREKPDNPAVTLLGHLGDRAIPLLIDAVMETEDSRVAQWAALALVAMGPKTVAKMLERGVDDSWIAFVVTGLGEPGQTALRDAMVSDNDAVRRAAQRFGR